MEELTFEQKIELRRFQKNEITESEVYTRLARVEKNEANRAVLLRIAAEEAGHASLLKLYTGEWVCPARLSVWWHYWTARLLGITFAIKRMESCEHNAHHSYHKYTHLPVMQQLAEDEERHERELIGLINEERLAYMGSVVLGLNDALVEFTGALAGFTLALNSAPLIALTGSITGIAAALSMASSEYLSVKSEGGDDKHPLKAALYTGIAYLVTVSLLVSPFVWVEGVLPALGVMLLMALSVIAVFNYYYAVARDESFKKRFTEMAVLSFSVAGVSFLIGYLLKLFTGIDS